MSVEENGHKNGEVEEISTRENSTAEHRFDDLARGLANGTVSRGRALRLFGAALVGAALGSVPGVALAAPPSGCKPEGAKCIVSRECCSQNCFTLKGKLICGPVLGACFSIADCPDVPLNQCEKKTCINGVCGVGPDQNKPCNDNDPCTTGDTCTAAGVCVGTPKTCQASNNPCVAETVCDPLTGNCREVPVPADANVVCRQAQGECDLPAVCTGTTTCPDNPLKEAGTVCRAADGPCDVAEVCTGTSNQCPENRFQPNDTPCNLDEDLCTLDTCQNGVCQKGPQKTCPASTDPCKVNVCNPATGGCVTQNAPNDTPCEDGDLCTLNDTCQNGTCRSGTAKTCPASADPCKVNVCVPATGNCVPQNAPNGTPCTDNNQCTTVDTCQNGTCQGSSSKTCPPNQTCVPATGNCQCTTGVTCGNLCCSGNQATCCPAGTRRAGQCRSNLNACNQ